MKIKRYPRNTISEGCRAYLMVAGIILLLVIILISVTPIWSYMVETQAMVNRCNNDYGNTPIGQIPGYCLKYMQRGGY
jgi:hypothetical protein